MPITTVYSTIVFLDFTIRESEQVITEILVGTELSLLSPGYPEFMSSEKQEINCVFER